MEKYICLTEFVIFTFNLTIVSNQRQFSNLIAGHKAENVNTLKSCLLLLGEHRDFVCG